MLSLRTNHAPDWTDLLQVALDRQELPHLMRNWVEIELSIPCFLTSFMLKCYDKSKRDREMSGVGE